MKKAYALIHGPSLGSAEEIKTFLDKRPEISNWRIELPNTIFILSDKDMRYLSGLFRGFDRSDTRFLLTEITGNKQGWLSKESWDFLNGTPTAKIITDDEVPF